MILAFWRSRNRKRAGHPRGCAGRGAEVAVGRHDAEPVHIAAVEQVHRVDGHAHVGCALALHDIELLHRDNRVGPGEIAPALEARLRPIAVGAADVDGAELAQNQQYVIQMVGRRVIRIDQQGNIGFLVRQEITHHESFRSFSSAGTRMTTVWRAWLFQSGPPSVGAGTKRRLMRLKPRQRTERIGR